MKKVFGMMLLLMGGAVAVYGFNAPNAVNPHLATIINGAPTLKTVILLWGGAAVAVIGGNLALPPSNKV